MGAWGWLVLAGVMEIVWATGLKQSDGFRHLGTSAWTVAAMILSFVLLSRAMREIPVGTAYAVWTGIGAVGMTAVGILMFDEPRDWLRIGCIGLVVVGIVGLKLTARA